MNSGADARLLLSGSLHKISENLELLLSWIKLILEAITFKSGSKRNKWLLPEKTKVIVHLELQHTMLLFEWQLHHLDYISNVLPCEHVRCLTVRITGCMKICNVKFPSILFSISILSATLYFIHGSLLYPNSLYSWHKMVSVILEQSV